MKKLMALILFVSISFICVAEPKFVIVGGDEYNWGKVKPSDAPLKASVVFKNEGTEDLIIKKVRAGCGCTAAKPAKDTLSPGDTTIMDVVVQIGSNNGLFNKTVTIETNDPNKKTTTYKLVCDIVRDIIIKPSEMMGFKGSNVVAGNEATETIYIKNNSKKNIKFYDLKVEPDIVKLTIPTEFTLRPDEEIEVTGKVTPEKSGPFHAQIKFKTDNPENPTLSIGVHGHANPNPLLNE